MKWNLENITFLHPPDVFTGTFDNALMQARHEQQVQAKLDEILTFLERETDPAKALNRLHKKEHLTFFLNNEEMFRQAGVFEETLLALYGKANSPFAISGDLLVWNRLFSACDRTRLFNLGSPVTFAAATVYRGSQSGLLRSLCWTPERRKALWFAERWSDPVLKGGDLYEVDIHKADILVHLMDRHEQQVILAPEFIASAEIRPFMP